MSLERRKPFAHLQPNAKPVEAAAAHPTISRPRRQMAAYHYHHQLQHNPHKRYATMFPGSSRSSATSSAESVYSITNNSMQPRRRKLSAAEDVAARVRARWAALEALERTSASVSASPQPAEVISGIATSAAGIRTGARMGPRVPEQQSPYSVLAPPDHELDRANDKENENAALWMMQQMQVDGQAQDEKPLPPRPAALGLRINPSSQPAHAPASAATTMAVPMVLDTRNDRDDATPRNDESVPTSDSTLQTTPTSMTCIEMGSLRPVLQRRPTRALTPPQVRRRPSITDELEAAREEATLMMLQSSRTDGLLRCPRRGCDELLSGVRALTFHLHIHAVSAGAAYTCVRCGGGFESARDLTRHSCARRRARERLRSVVRAWTCLSSTGQNFGKQQQEKPQQSLQQSPKHYKRTGKDDNSYY